MSTRSQTLNAFLANAAAAINSTPGSIKSAASLEGVKDPTDKGTVTPPEASTPEEQAKMNVPNPGKVNKNVDRPISETQPLANTAEVSTSGGGTVPATRNGNALDDISSPTAPLSKIAQTDFNLPESCTPEILCKLAAYIVQDEELSALVNRQIARDLGAAEATNIIKLATAEYNQLVDAQNAEQPGNITPKAAAAIANFQDNMLVYRIKQASYRAIQNNINNIDAERGFDKSAAVQHSNWFTSDNTPFQYDFEKAAYAQGMEDADMLAATGDVPEGGEGFSAEDVIGIMESLVESGQMDPQLAELYLASVLEGAAQDPSGQVSVTEDQLVAGLTQLMQEGAIDEAQAQAIAQAFTQAEGAEGGIPPEAAGMPEGEAPMDPAMEQAMLAEKQAAYKNAAVSTNIINAIF